MAAPQSPRGTTGAPASPTANPAAAPSSYGGELYQLFFNGVARLSTAIGRREVKITAGVPLYILGTTVHSFDGEIARREFEDAVEQLQYFCYRNRMPIPLTNRADHDAGWGCMVRTGQMMLCAALKRLLPIATEADRRTKEHAEAVASMFQDIPTAPFSIHNMTDEGALHHIPVGTWFNPTATAYTLRSLVRKSPVTSEFVDVVIAAEATLKTSDVEAVLATGKAALIVIPMMAGAERVNASSAAQILKCFEVGSCLGIVGGRPKHSLYFFGAQADQLFYFDPHIVLSAFVSADTMGEVPPGALSSLPVSDMDPSMLVCFTVASLDDLARFESDMTQKVFPLGEFALFSVIRKKGTAAVTAATAAPATTSTQPQAAIPSADADDLDLPDDLEFPDEAAPETSAPPPSGPPATIAPPPQPAGPLGAAPGLTASRPRCAGSIAVVPRGNNSS